MLGNSSVEGRPKNGYRGRVKVYDPGWWRTAGSLLGIKQARGLTYQALLGRNAPQFAPTNFRTLSREYERNEIVFACLDRIVKSFVEAPPVVMDGKGQRVTQSAGTIHPFETLLQNPNPFMSGVELWQKTLLHYYFAGNAFWEKVRFKRGRGIAELWPLEPDRVRIIPDVDDFIAGYVYLVGGKEIEFGVDEVIHFKHPHPTQPYFGQAPTKAAARRLAIDNARTDFVAEVLQNSGLPAFLIETALEKITEADSDALTERWLEKFGPGKRHKPMFMTKGMKAEAVGYNFEELAMPDLSAQDEARICAVFGVPPILVGLKVGLDRSTFSNYEEARRSHQQDNIQPLYNYFDDVLSSRLLVPDFGGAGLKVGFDVSDVAALAELRGKRFEMGEKAVAGGWAMVNEARALVGWPTVPGGDVFLRDFAKVATPPTARPPATPASAPTSDEDTGTKGVGGRRTATVIIQDGRKLRTILHAPRGRPCPDVKARRRERDVTLLRLVFGRISTAERHLAKLQADAVAEFKAQAKDVDAILKGEGIKALTASQNTRLIERLTAQGFKWRTGAADRLRPRMSMILGDAAEAAAKEIGFTFDMSSAQAVEFVRSYSFQFAERITATSVDDMRSIFDSAFREGVSDEEIRQRVAAVSERWQGARAENVARSETVRAANHGAILSWSARGVTGKEWVAADDACEFCDAMDGTVLGIDENYFDKGSEFQPEGVESVLRLDYDDTQAPPLHPQCRCSIAPVILEG